MGHRIWIRLGGYVTVDTIDEHRDIESGNLDALVNALKKHGFDVDGDTYIPMAMCDVEFDIDPMKLVAADGGNV